MNTISHKDAARRSRAKELIDRQVRSAVQEAKKQGFHAPFLRLLYVVYSRSELLSRMPIGGRSTWLTAETMLRGIFALARWHKTWKREPELWSGVDSSPLLAFGKLAAHLFALKPVPRFLNLVWFQPHSSKSIYDQTLYRHVAAGLSLRGMKTPIVITKRMERTFLHAPDECTVEQAFRWCKHCEKWLSRSIRSNTGVIARLRVLYLRRSHWSKVKDTIRRLRRRQRFLAMGIVRYFTECKNGDPILSLNSRRKLAQVLQEIEYWHLCETSNPSGIFAGPAWPIADIAGWDQTIIPANSRFPIQWSIRQIVSLQQLKAEAQEMQHCVASYAEDCKSGMTTIWSMQRNGGFGSQRILTIEVNPRTLAIIQAKGKLNKLPTPFQRNLLQLWADKARLRIDRRV